MSAVEKLTKVEFHMVNGEVLTLMLEEENVSKLGKGIANGSVLTDYVDDELEDIVNLAQVCHLRVVR